MALPKTNLKDPRKPHERLSFMQYYVAMRLVQGLKTPYAIARTLSIHRTTVERHERKLFQKMQISSRKELIEYARTHGVFNGNSQT